MASLPPRDRPDIEITEEMVEAGLAALFPSEVAAWEVPADVVSRVFSAMWSVLQCSAPSPRRHPDTQRSPTPSPPAEGGQGAWKAERARDSEGGSLRVLMP